MSEVEKFIFEDAEGNESAYTTYDSVKAKEFAIRNHFRCIANKFEFSDSEVVYDYTEKAQADEFLASRYEKNADCPYCGHSGTQKVMGPYDLAGSPLHEIASSHTCERCDGKWHVYHKLDRVIELDHDGKEVGVIDG